MVPTGLRRYEVRHRLRWGAPEYQTTQQANWLPAIPLTLLSVFDENDSGDTFYI